MKARSLTFYIEPDHLEEVVRVLDEQIVPEYRELPNFVGLVVLQADHVRREVVCLSIWDRDMEASEEGIARFRRRITSVSGASAAMETFDVLRLLCPCRAPPRRLGRLQ